MAGIVLINDIVEGSILSSASSTDILLYDTAVGLRGNVLNSATFSMTSTIVGYDSINKLGAGGRITSFFRINEGIVQIGATHIDVPVTADLLVPSVTFSHVISSLSVILRVSGSEGGQTVLWRGRSEITVIKS